MLMMSGHKTGNKNSDIINHGEIQDTGHRNVNKTTIKWWFGEKCAKAK